MYKDYQVKKGIHCKVQKDPLPCLQHNSSTDKVYITAISNLSIQNHLLTIDLAWIQQTPSHLGNQIS